MILRIICEESRLQINVIAAVCARRCPHQAAVASNEPRQRLRCDEVIAKTLLCLISDISCLNGPAASGEVEGVEVIIFHLPGRCLWQDCAQSVFHRLFLISRIDNGSRHEERKTERNTGLES